MSNLSPCLSTGCGCYTTNMCYQLTLWDLIHDIVIPFLLWLYVDYRFIAGPQLRREAEDRHDKRIAKRLKELDS